MCVKPEPGHSSIPLIIVTPRTACQHPYAGRSEKNSGFFVGPTKRLFFFFGNDVENALVMVSNSPRDLSQSNSTAFLFLGSARRNWMEPVEPRREMPPAPVLPHPNVSAENAVSLTTDIPSRGPRAENPVVTPATIPSPAPTIVHPSPGTSDVLSPSIPTPVDGNNAMAARSLDDAQRDPRPGDIESGVPAGHTHGMPMGRGPSFPNISEETWSEWLARLDALVADVSRKGLLKSPAASGILKPRLELLRKAITYRDPFYLAVHQVYCLCTIAPSYIGRMGFAESGLHTLAMLVEDNHKMHLMATTAFAQFPGSPEQLFAQAWYQNAIRSLPLFLSRMASSWLHFWASSTRAPLVTEMVTHFALPGSPVMMSVMSTCITRHLHQEKYMGQLQRLFWGDWMFWQTKQPHERAQNHDETLIREYLKFPRVPRNEHQIVPPNRPVASHPTRVVSPTVRSPIPGTSQTMVPHSSPDVRPVTTQVQAALPGQVGQIQQLGNSQAQALEGSSPRQWVQGPSPVYGDQVRRMSSPLNPQSQAQASLQDARIHAQRQMLALRHGQVSPFRNQMGDEWHARAANLHSLPALATSTSASPVSPAPAHPSPVALSHSHPLPNTQRSHSASTPTTQTGHNTRPVVSQLPQHPGHQHSPASQYHIGLPARPPQGVQTLPSRHPNPSPGLHPSNLPHPPSFSPQSPIPSQLSSPLFPAPGYRAPVTVNGDPLRLGLHLANLRDPMKKLVKPGPDGQMTDAELFAYFGTFLVLPCLIKVDEPGYTWKFNLNKGDLSSFPITTGASDKGPMTRTYKPGNRTVRLRCISHAGDPNSFSHDRWTTSPTSWPSVFYIHVNGKELQVRRKVQHLRDLALDITKSLKEGENIIQVDLLLGPDECKKSSYFFAVEVMEVTTLENVLSLVKTTSAADSRAEITKRLSSLADDDDLAFVTDSLTIGLVDPFTARIFDIPARSKYCNHRECFDRDTFVQTRKSVSGPGPMIYEWRCPICKADARPQLLIVDGFLAEVHAQLIRTNQLEGATAIQIKADGTWTLKASEETSSEAQKNSSKSASLKRKAPDAATSHHTAMQTKQEPNKRQSPSTLSNNHEIIELD
ncbi:unnamed protein product [Penicillium olsonii]|uniref:SP-RING-type domain-containing protein n=1 Tax=Penicillium olsonii TaxID=99116 RepID=A0A9W4HNS5_PENOL|nr:unnamed protein product [Penicillium olsonii]CAG8102262.1 unnamed protein product [Penicillium olsonii]